MTKIGERWGYLFSALLIVFATATAVAEDAKVVATVDRNELGLGDTLQLTISIQSKGNVSADEPRVPQLQGFSLVNTSTSTSVSSKLMPGPQGMQFESIRRQDYIFLLSPQRAGNLQIPGFEVVVDGKVQVTKPILVKVSPEGSGAGRLPPGRPDDDELDEAEQLFQQLLQRRGAVPPTRGQVIPRNPNETFFIHLDVDKKEVYEGEQITAEWSIYTRGNILSLDRTKFPDLKGFWKEIIEEVPALNFTQEVLNGIPYRRALLASHALFPIKPGIAIIDEYKVKANVQAPSAFGQFGFGHAYTFTRASPRLEIKVKPLPTAGKPKDFTGAVGKFDVAGKVEGNQFPVNQPFSYKIRFEGTGNAKLIELPPLELPPGFEVFDTKSDSKFFKNGRSFKEFEVLIIPRQTGEIHIPPLSVSMFDPATARYYTKATDAQTVQVVPAAEGEAKQDSRLKTAAATQSTVAAHVMPPVVTDAQVGSWSLLSGRWWSVALFWLLALGALGFKTSREFSFGNRRSSLKHKLSRQLRKVDKVLNSGDWRKVGTELMNTCYQVLGSISDVGGAHLEIGKLLDHLPPSVRREQESEIRKLIDGLQVLCFAPEELVGSLKEASQLKQLRDQTEKVLNRAIDLVEKD